MCDCNCTSAEYAEQLRQINKQLRELGTDIRAIRASAKRAGAETAKAINRAVKQR